MALHGKVLIALAVTLLALIHTAESRCHNDDLALGEGLGAPQCGRQAGNRKCPNNLCCSKFGFCGDTREFCARDQGCQSQCRPRDLGEGLDAPQCGRQAGNRKCPNNLCCSKFGFCGNTHEYCDKDQGCQSQCHRHGGLSASTGKASYYSTYIPSACYGNDASHFPQNRYMAAVSDGNPNLWKNGQGCGKHYRIRCVGNGCRNGDAITIQVVDRCPNGCQGRVFDLSAEAFGALADKNAGVIKVDYAPIERDDAIPWAQEELIVEVGHIRE
jgi:hypothetical protein